MKLIIDIFKNCACAVTNGVPDTRAYYSRTTSKVLPMSLHMYCGINRWPYFREKSSFWKTSFRKGGWLVFEGGPFLAIMVLIQINCHCPHWLIGVVFRSFFAMWRPIESRNSSSTTDCMLFVTKNLHDIFHADQAQHRMVTTLTIQYFPRRSWKYMYQLNKLHINILGRSVMLSLEVFFVLSSHQDKF